MKNFKLCLSAAIVGIILICISTIWIHRNVMVDMEEAINAQYTTNKSTYDNMWKKFKEMTEVTDVQAEQIKEVYDDVIKNRNKDTKLLFKSVHEQNPQLNTKVYENLQLEIASSREVFNNNQKTISDIIREYNSYVRKKVITSAIFNRKPKRMEDFIITSEETENAFKTKKTNKIQLRDKKEK